MADIKDAGKANIAKAVPPKVVEPIGQPQPEEPGRVIIPDERLIDKRIMWTPEQQARYKLTMAEKQVNQEIAALDKAIAERSKGLSPWQRFADPVLRDLRAARAELGQAEADLKAARTELDGRLPFYKLGLAYMGPIDRTPDLAAAEARINSALGHLDKAQYHVGEALESLPPEPFIGCKHPGGHIWHGNTLRGQLNALSRDISETQQTAREARENVWEAQEAGPTKPWPPKPWPPRPLPAPIPQEFPPYYLKYADAKQD
ncbi:MAG: hypothetical protein FJZ01_18615 [Candidatus Sericytochromatia bacterium]|nr:hypothetical protein [Candidatus Tanganyikabacteria bacterium]